MCPGFIRGGWLKKGLGAPAYEQGVASNDRSTPLHSTLGPEDVAASVVALAATPLVTGQLLAVDAGMGLDVIALPPNVHTHSAL